MNTFIYRSKFPLTKETLFQFHESEIGFETLVGGSKGIEIIKPPSSLQVGEEVILKVSILPFWKKIWVAKHTAYQKNHFFEDTQIEGPFLKFQHKHRFLDLNEEKTFCILSDEVEIDYYLWPISRYFLFPILFSLFRKRHKLTANYLGVKESLILCRYS